MAFNGVTDSPHSRLSSILISPRHTFTPKNIKKGEMMHGLTSRGTVQQTNIEESKDPLGPTEAIEKSSTETDNE
jgi:hypothetical protein